MIAGEWIRTELPRSWKVARLCDQAKVVNGYPFDSELFTADTGLPLVRIRDIAGVDTEVRYAGDPVPEALLKGGEILVGMDGDFNVARWQGGEALLNQRVCCVRPGPNIDGRFLYYVLPAPLSLINEFTYSTTVKHLSSFDVLKIHLPFPPLAQQRAIADYLDRETVRLDALVAAKERVLGLLAEKRRALITRAVTRGLDPRAPLRDSGIPWLAEIPAHWTSTRLRFLGRFKGGAGFPHEEQGLRNEDLPFFKVKDLSQSEHTSELTDTDNSISYSTAERLRAFVFPTGTIVFAKVGAALLLSRFQVLGAPGCIDNNMMGFMVYEAVVDRDFALIVMRLINFAEVVNPGAVPSLNEGQIGDQPVALPPLEEQRAIVAHLREETARLDRLVEANARTIALLKERRAALVAAAVTGQIALESAA